MPRLENPAESALRAHSVSCSPLVPGTAFGNPNSLTTYLGGLTVAYSNLASASGTGGKQFPAEIVFTHLETLGASAAGAEKGYRDSIEMRFYLRARR